MMERRWLMRSFAHGADGGKHCEELFHGKIRLVDGDKYRETEG